MSIFTKPVSQMGVADLRELLDDDAVENIRLEFKSEVPTKDDTLKKLSSFANTFGGFMVVGAKAPSTDGHIEALPGVDPQSGYKQKIVDWCYAGANPPLTVEVSDAIAVENGKVCYVIYVPESDVAPHFLNGRNGIWVRTDEFSGRFSPRLAEENELRHLLDRRKVIVDRRTALMDRARRRSNTHLGPPNASRLELCVVPRFPSRPLCPQQDLDPLVTSTTITQRGVYFPNQRGGFVSQYESVALLGPLLDSQGFPSLFEANIWGMLFYAMRAATNEGGEGGIHLYRIIGSVLVFLRHAARMFEQFPYVGPLVVDTNLTAIRGAKWLHDSGGDG